MQTHPTRRLSNRLAALSLGTALLVGCSSGAETVDTTSSVTAVTVDPTMAPEATEPPTTTEPPVSEPAAIEPSVTPPQSFPPESSLGQQLTGTGITASTFTVGDATIDALVAGPSDGEAVLLLHGFPSTNYQWRFQMVALADAGYRVIAPNQRGYSAGARPPDIVDYRIDLLAQDVVDIATAAGIDRFHVVGHDWGAAVTWMVAINHPERLVSLTAVSVPHPAAYGTARLDPTGEQSSKAGYIDRFVQEGFEDRVVADDAAFLRGIYASAGLTSSEMQPYLDVLGTREAAGAALNWYRANSLDSEPDAPAVATPTLFVFSTNDCCLGRDAADLTVGYVTGPYTYEVLEGVSHWVTEQAPDDLNEALLTHLASNPSEPT